MADIDLNAFSLPELKQLEKNVAKTITSFEDRRKAEARAKVDELARELGFSFEELAEAAPPANVRHLRRSTAIRNTPRSPGPVAVVNRHGSQKRLLRANRSR